MNTSYAINLEEDAVFRSTDSYSGVQGRKQLLCNPWMLLACKITIGVVSAYDVFLTIKYVDSLHCLELNPIGRWLMVLDDDNQCQLSQTAAFIASKFAGNFIVLCVIESLAHWKRYMSGAVAVALAAFQLLLLYFLCFSDPLNL